MGTEEEFFDILRRLYGKLCSSQGKIPVSMLPFLPRKRRYLLSNPSPGPPRGVALQEEENWCGAPLAAPGPHLWWSNSPVVGPQNFQALKIRGILTEKINSNGI